MSFLLEVGALNPRASVKGSFLSWGASLTHELGTYFLLDLGSFPLKEEITKVWGEGDVLLCGSKSADSDVTDPAIQLHGD